MCGPLKVMMQASVGCYRAIYYIYKLGSKSSFTLSKRRAVFKYYTV